MSNYSDSAYSDDPNSSWRKIYDYIKPGSSVLDVGCSSGNFGKVLIDEKKCLVDGVELDVGDVKAAKKHLNEVYHLNIETDDLSAIRNKYDYIYFGDVIEHLFWPTESLKKMQNFLKPGGQIVFSIPNMAHLSVRLMLLGGDFTYGETGLLDKTHLHFYTVKEVERIFNAAGYNIVNFDPVLKDFPDELINKELKKYGLSKSDAFVNFTRTTEASIYQIVGAASPTKDKRKAVTAKLDASSPVDKFQTLLDQTKEYYENQLKDQQEHIKKLEKYAKDTVEKYEEVQKQLVERDKEIYRLKQSVIKRVSAKLGSRTKSK